jgi:hypothetical protein
VPADSRPRLFSIWAAIVRGAQHGPQVNSPEEGLQFNRKKITNIIFFNALEGLERLQKPAIAVPRERISSLVSRALP